MSTETIPQEKPIETIQDLLERVEERYPHWYLKRPEFKDEEEEDFDPPF